MAACGRDCESDSKMQYCRAFGYRIDENRCTVVSFNEKLIKNMHFPLGKQWFSVQRIKNTNDFQCFSAKLDENHSAVANECESIVRRLWNDCETDPHSSQMKALTTGCDHGCESDYCTLVLNSSIEMLWFYTGALSVLLPAGPKHMLRRVILVTKICADRNWQ